MVNDLVLGMVGAGGDGVISAGESIMYAASREGYRAIMTKSFGSQIRGGESSFRIRLSTERLWNAGGVLDVVVVLDWEGFLRLGAELPVTGRTTVIYDAAPGGRLEELPLAGVVPREAVAVPIGELARQHGGSDKAKNTVVLGLLAQWLGLPIPALLAGLAKRFARKSAEVLQSSERAFAAGVEFAVAHPLKTPRALERARMPAKPPLLTDGNDMCAAGAIFAGCSFFSGYPITPSTEIMQFLGRELWKYGGTVMQAEDEIAGIGAVVGASFAGRKAMTATSGPGMSLKAEVLGLATIAELPLVCVNVQRGGPSTGIPTKSEQSDLFQAAFSAHGDALRPVIAPTGVADMFVTTIDAFNIAEQYQTPVILLSDAEIAQRKEIVDPIDTSLFAVVDRREPNDRELEHYIRFEITESGISPISHPGVQGGNYLASGIEHNPSGAPTANGAVHARMNDKRFRKLNWLKSRRDLFSIEGEVDAPIALVSWGSVAGVAREAAIISRREGLRLKILVPRLLYPISEEVFAEFFASVKAGLVVEQSHQGQLYRIIRMFVDVPSGVVSFTRSGSNPISPHEIVDRLKEMAATLQREQIPDPEPRLG
jgi:2-oxoglutarate ferredoxin oxidoreductase subunit alpha